VSFPVPGASRFARASVARASASSTVSAAYSSVLFGVSAAASATVPSSTVVSTTSSTTLLDCPEANSNDSPDVPATTPERNPGASVYVVASGPSTAV